METEPKKRGRPAKVKEDEAGHTGIAQEGISSSIPEVKTEYVTIDIFKSLINQFTDLRSRIEAIENFRNTGAIEGKIQGLYDSIDAQNDKITGLIKKFNDIKIS